jgi:uncharacterized protein
VQSAIEAFLDIETTGLSPACCQITVVGVHLTNGTEGRLVQLVGGDATADRLLEALEGTSMIYSYNGSRFDLPFIHSRLGVDIAGLFPHRDLMHDCWRRGLYGGLKAVERQLGIQRRLRGVDGLEAVRLWWRYVNDYDEAALATLLEYNREDVLSLKSLRARLL